MRARRLIWIFLPLLLSGCDSRDPAPPYELVADVRELMLTVVEPAAEVYWDAVGWVEDQDGAHEIRPTTDEEWEAVLNAAYTVAESGNLLMMDGRARDTGGWMTMSRAMIEAGRKAIAAASSKDDTAVFDAGADLYYTCNACHAAYAIDVVRPNVTLE